MGRKVCDICDGNGYTEYMRRGYPAVLKERCVCQPPLPPEPEPEPEPESMPVRQKVASGRGAAVHVHKEFDGTRYLYTPQEEAAGARYIVPGSREGRREFARAIANKTQLPCSVE